MILMMLMFMNIMKMFSFVVNMVSCWCGVIVVWELFFMVLGVVVIFDFFGWLFIMWFLFMCSWVLWL